MGDRLAEIRERWAAATPGPYRLEGAKWALDGEPDSTISGALVAHCGWIGSVQGRCTKATALALAGAPDDVAWLVAEIDRLQVVSFGVLAQVAKERARQDAKWGPQNHPDADPVLLGRAGGVDGQRLAEELEIPSAARAKFLCRMAGNRGADNWGAILVEELAEAVDAIGDDAALRAELVQVAAVAVAWVEAIDRRAQPGGAR